MAGARTRGNTGLLVFLADGLGADDLVGQRVWNTSANRPRFIGELVG